MQEDRSWAVGLSQGDFIKEFKKKYLGYDIVPDVVSWTANVHKYEYHGIDGINPENLKKEKTEVQPEKAVEFACKGCDRKFTHRIALIGHQKHCKGLLNVRV